MVPCGDSGSSRCPARSRARRATSRRRVSTGRLFGGSCRTGAVHGAAGRRGCGGPASRGVRALGGRKVEKMKPTGGPGQSATGKERMARVNGADVWAWARAKVAALCCCGCQVGIAGHGRRRARLRWLASGAGGSGRGGASARCGRERTGPAWGGASWSAALDLRWEGKEEEKARKRAGPLRIAGLDFFFPFSFFFFKQTQTTLKPN